jgi:hypothetical protein
MPRGIPRGDFECRQYEGDNERIMRCLAPRTGSFHETSCKRQDLIP